MEQSDYAAHLSRLSGQTTQPKGNDYCNIRSFEFLAESDSDLSVAESNARVQANKLDQHQNILLTTMKNRTLLKGS